MWLDVRSLVFGPGLRSGLGDLHVSPQDPCG